MQETRLDPLMLMVKELVNVMGGKIEVKSKPGMGTRFKIHFPVS